MSEALIGVIVGGFIASLAPIINLLLEHRRWKRQAKLEFLKQRRDKLEQLYTDTYAHLIKAVDDESYSLGDAFEMAANIIVMSSGEIYKEFSEYVRNISSDKKIDKGDFLLRIKIEMKKSFAEIDSDINNLIG